MVTPFGYPLQAEREGLRWFGIKSARSRVERRETGNISIAGKTCRAERRAA